MYGADTLSNSKDNRSDGNRSRDAFELLSRYVTNSGARIGQQPAAKLSLQEDDPDTYIHSELAGSSVLCQGARYRLVDWYYLCVERAPLGLTSHFAGFVLETAGGMDTLAVTGQHATKKALTLTDEYRGAPKGEVCHSDQGCQYTSLEYQLRLWRNQMVQSMSRRETARTTVQQSALLEA